MQTVMGIDLGTQSIKVIIYNPENRVVMQTASSPFQLISRDDGSREQMAHWWIDGLRNCLKEFSSSLKSTVRAIGVSGQQHGFVPVSDTGEVLAPVKLWCDTSTVKECDEIAQAVGGEKRCIELGGNAIAAGYTASKILWLKKNNPDAYRAMTSVMLPHDYLNFYLTGRRIMECGDASGTGLLNVRQKNWSVELIKAVDGERNLLDCFPELIEADQPAGVLLPELAEELGFAGDVLVSAGGGDNMMAAIGTGNVSAGKLTASMGTSGTLFGFSDEPIVDSYGELAAFCSSTGGWLPLLCTMNCTVATEQLRSLFSVAVEDVDHLARKVRPGCDGLITLPFYNGERTPALPNGKAVLFGLDMDNTTQAHCLRSAMEAAVFGLKTGLLAFQRCGMSFDQLTLTGGGSASELWCQICADVFNMPVTVLKESENAAIGAALQALWCFEKNIAGNSCITIQELTETHLDVEVSRCSMPDPESVAVYENIYKQYTTLLNTVAPLYLSN